MIISFCVYMLRNISVCQYFNNRKIKKSENVKFSLKYRLPGIVLTVNFKVSRSDCLCEMC